MSRTSLPHWKHVLLGTLSGLATYTAIEVLWTGVHTTVLAGGVGSNEEQYFASKYLGASEIDMARALDECRHGRDTLQQKAVEALLSSGSYEIVSAAPATGQVKLTPRPRISWISLESFDSSGELYRKVSIPRGFDPELDLLIEECLWLEGALFSDDQGPANLFAPH